MMSTQERQAASSAQSEISPGLLSPPFSNRGSRAPHSVLDGALSSHGRTRLRFPKSWSDRTDTPCLQCSGNFGRVTWSITKANPKLRQAEVTRGHQWHGC